MSSEKTDPPTPCRHCGRLPETEKGSLDELRAEVARLRRAVEAERLVGRQGPDEKDKEREATEREWDSRWMPRFLEALKQTGVARQAMRAVARHVRSTRTFYQYRQDCERFKLAWDAALEAHGASQWGET